VRTTAGGLPERRARSSMPGRRSRQRQAFPRGLQDYKDRVVVQKEPCIRLFRKHPDTLKTLAFIVKDTKRFPNTHGWAYAQWAYDPATDTLKPSELDPTGAECGYACHSKVASQDYIYTAYPKR
jgi:Cytochrome P460